MSNIKKSRGWCFTLFGYTTEHKELLATLDAQYIVFGEEICPTTGNPHLQGYIYFPLQKTMSAVKRIMQIDTIHLLPAKGTGEQNRTYCSKSGKFQEFGQIPIQGKRNDLDMVRDTLHKHEPLPMSVITDTATSFQSVRLAQTWLTYHERERNWKTIVHWFYGPSGCGKSLCAKRMCMQLSNVKPYKAKGTSKWWDGYDGHENVIIDDMRGDFIKFHDLLNLLDQDEYSVEVKGGYRQFLARFLFITCPYHPIALFKGQTDECMKQLMRRIDFIRHFSENDLKIIQDYTKPIEESFLWQDDEHKEEDVDERVLDVDDGEGKSLARLFPTHTGLN